MKKKYNTSVIMDSRNSLAMHWKPVFKCKKALRIEKSEELTVGMCLKIIKNPEYTRTVF